MRAFIQFNKGMMNMPIQWQLWLALLVTANLAVPIFFIGRMEAQIVVGTLFISMMLMTYLTSLTGFTRLLGLGHILWFPLLYFLWVRLEQIPADNVFGIWLRVLMALNAASLMIDVIDVIRYAAGDLGETGSLLRDN